MLPRGSGNLNRYRILRATFDNHGGFVPRGAMLRTRGSGVRISQAAQFSLQLQNRFSLRFVTQVAPLMKNPGQHAHTVPAARLHLFPNRRRRSQSPSVSSGDPTWATLLGELAAETRRACGEPIVAGDGKKLIVAEVAAMDELLLQAEIFRSNLKDRYGSVMQQTFASKDAVTSDISEIAGLTLQHILTSNYDFGLGVDDGTGHRGRALTIIREPNVRRVSGLIKILVFVFPAPHSAMPLHWSSCPYPRQETGPARCMAEGRDFEM